MSGKQRLPPPADLAQAIYDADPEYFLRVCVIGEGRARRFFCEGGKGLNQHYEASKTAVMTRVRAAATALGYRLGIAFGDRVMDAMVDGQLIHHIHWNELEGKVKNPAYLKAFIGRYTGTL